jgi:hypothetical protein
MTERKQIISGLNISYEGLFDVKDFLMLIEDWFKQNGYDKNEMKHVERVREKGKFIDIEIAPTKEVSDYVRNEIYVRIQINDLVEAKIKKNKTELKINKGNVSIDISAYLQTDYQEKMESKPLMFFWRAISEKFINKKYTGKSEKQLTNDVQNFHSEIKAYLNLERFVIPS